MGTQDIKFLAVDFTDPSSWEPPACHEYIAAGGANCVPWLQRS